MATNTDIRTQAEMNAFVQSVPEAFDKIGWEVFLHDESGLTDRVYGRYFQEAKGPDGKTWKVNAPRTIAKKGHKRRLFGLPSQGFRLHASLTTRNGEFSIRYEIDHWPERATMIHGTDHPHSAINDQGGGRIPARPHIGISGQYFDGIYTRSMDYAFDRLKKLLA